MGDQRTTRCGVAQATILTCWIVAAAFLSAGNALSGEPIPFTIDSRATFLHTCGDLPGPPVILDLAALGFAPGEEIVLTYDVCPEGFRDSGPYGPTSTADQVYVVGVFSSTNEYLPSTERYRVPGAIQSVEPYYTGPTLMGTEPIDIPEDFWLCPPRGCRVEIPAGARYLFVGVANSYYADNSGSLLATVRRVEEPTLSNLNPADVAQAPSPLEDPEPTVVSNPVNSAQSGLPRVAFGPTGQEQGRLPPDPNASATYYDDNGGVSGLPAMTNVPRRQDPMCTLVSDSVHLFSGRAHLRLTDLAMGAGSGSLMFDRYYSSGSTRRGQLGTGWSHTFERCVLDLGTTGAMEVDGRGVSLLFPPDGQGGYGAPARGGAKLTKESDGSWAVRYATGRTYRYQPGVQAGQGQSQSVQYAVDPWASFLLTTGDPATPPTRIDLTAVGLAPGNTVHLTYDEPAGGFRDWGPYGPTSPVDQIYILGVFSRTKQILSRTLRYRVPGAVDASDDFFADVTLLGNEPMDIPEDFRVFPSTGFSAVIPPNAKYLFLGLCDSYYYDNSGTINVTLTAPGGSASRLVALEDANGDRLDLTYNASNQLERVAAGTGQYLQFEVQDSMIRKITSSAGDKVEFSYTADGRLSNVLDVLNGTTGYTYDTASGDLTAIQRPSGDRTEYTYRSDQKVSDVRIVSQDGRASSNHIEYPTPLSRVFTDPVGRSTQYEFTESGRLAKRVDNDGSTYLVTCDQAGRPLSVTYPDQSVHSWAYAPDGAILSYTSPTGKVTRVVRDATTGWPTTLVNADGTSVQRTFDQVGNLIGTKDALNRTTQYVRDSHGRITSTVDPLGRAAHCRFDAKGDLVERINAAGGVTAYQRDAVGRPLQTTSPGGRVTKDEFLGLGLTKSRTNAAGQKTRFEYDCLGRIVATVLPNGARTQFGYQRVNGRDVIVETRDAIGGVSTAQYDDSGRLVARTDPLGRTTRFELDAVGRVAKVVPPCGDFVVARYNPAGLLSQVEDARGAVTRFLYDGEGRLERTELPDGTANSQSHDAMGRIVSRANAEASVEFLIYDAAGQLTAVMDPMGKVTRSEYTLSGAVARSYDARDHVTSFGHDNLDQVVTTTNALGHVTRKEYDLDGEVIATYDANGKDVRYTYDEAGRLSTVKDPLGYSVRRAYDDVGNVVSLTDENGHSWQFTYDLLGRKTTETDPNGKTTRFQYNAASELVLKTFADRTSWSYVRDCGGRVQEKQLLRAGGTVEDVYRYTYDVVGNRLTVDNAAVNVVSSYNVMNRETRRTVRYKATGASRMLSFLYDVMGRRQVTVDSHGRIVRYSYDKLSRPLEMCVTEPPSSLLFDWANLRTRSYKFSWDATSNLTQVTYPNSTLTRRSYDAVNRLTEIVHQGASGRAAGLSLQRMAYQLDPAGNVTQVTDDRAGTFHYEYDARNQLTKAVLPPSLVAKLKAEEGVKGKGKGCDKNRSRSCEDWDDDDDDDCSRRHPATQDIVYRYDPAGNRVEEIYGNQGVTATYSAANELLSRNGVSYLYDERGNLTEKVSPKGRKLGYAYNVAGQLVSVATGHEPGSHSGCRWRDRSGSVRTVERYSYCPDGFRVTAEDTRERSLIHFLWDDSRPVEEWAAPAAGDRRGQSGEHGVFYLHDPAGRTLEQIDYSRQRGAVRPDTMRCSWDDPDDDDRGPRGAVRTVAHARWFHADNLGSTRLLTDAAGRVTNRLVYGPWGEELTGKFDATRFTYAGTERDYPARLQYLGPRWYDPQAGRFAQRAPIGSEGGPVNLYQYAGNGPTSNVVARMEVGQAILGRLPR